MTSLRPRASPVATIIDAAEQIVRHYPEAAALATTILDEAIKLPARTAAQPIATAYNAEGQVLLYCPDREGWQIGVWLFDRWVSSVNLGDELKPTHWMQIPREPAS